MILGGDELGRTQGGNNNAYCQDGPLTWIDWAAAAHRRELTDFVARLCRLRREHRVFRRRQFFRGGPAEGDGHDDLAWFRPDGQPMSPADWNAGYARAVVIALGGASEARRATTRSCSCSTPGGSRSPSGCRPSRGR